MSKIDYEERRNEMSLLHRQQGWSMQKIADKFGVSRERVRQIIGSSNGARRELASKFEYKPNPNMTKKEMLRDIRQSFLPIKSVARDLIGKIHHAVSGNGTVYKGNSGEMAVSEKLNSLGISNQLMPLHHPFDILVKGSVKVDVKTATKKWKGYYRFHIRKAEKSDCDFFIFYSMEDDIFWVIPFSLLPKVQIAYIRAEKKRGRAKNSNLDELEKYKDRFDLL